LQFSFAPATFEQTTLGGEMRYILIILFLSASLLAGEHGIYLRVAKQVQGDFATVKETVKKQPGFRRVQYSGRFRPGHTGTGARRTIQTQWIQSRGACAQQ
jgi:hypothetical protein